MAELALRPSPSRALILAGALLHTISWREGIQSDSLRVKIMAQKRKTSQVVKKGSESVRTIQTKKMDLQGEGNTSIPQLSK